MKIAIQANPNRGKEIISLLESLGGNNIRWEGDARKKVYYIDKHNVIQYGDAPKGYKVYTLEEFETQFPFKVGDLCIYSSDILGEDIVVRILGMTIENDCVMYEVGHRDITKQHSYIYKERKTLKSYKEMNTRNVTLTLDKAKEWYKKGGELKEIALQAFTEKELNPLPRSWEEYCKQGNPVASWRYNIPIKYEALFKLEQLRDCWRKGWVQTPTDTGYRICKSLTGGYTILSVGTLKYFLAFPTEEMAREFYECFKDLIEQAGDLI